MKSAGVQVFKIEVIIFTELLGLLSKNTKIGILL